MAKQFTRKLLVNLDEETFQKLQDLVDWSDWFGEVPSSGEMMRRLVRQAWESEINQEPLRGKDRR